MCCLVSSRSLPLAEIVLLLSALRSSPPPSHSGEQLCVHTLQERMERHIRLLPSTSAAGGRQHCSDVPPCSLRHCFALYPPISGMRNLFTCPLLGCKFFWCGFWTHRPFLSLSFPFQCTHGMGGGLADRGRILQDTPGQRPAYCLGSLSSSEDSLTVLPRIFLNPNHTFFFSSPAEGNHSKKHTLRS